MRARILLATALLLPFPGRAETPTEARLREALRSATNQLRAAEDERAAAKAREAALQKELDALKAQPRPAPAPVPKSNPKDVAELKKKVEKLTEAAERGERELLQCQAASRESAEALRARESERVRTGSEAALLREQLAAAEAKNEQLYRVGKDIIEWLRGQGVGAAMAAREPFLGLKRVQLENIAQDQEDKLLEHRICPAAPTPP
jgi:hypothetical protein